MNFIRLVEEIPNESSAVLFLQNHGILHQNRICQNGHDMKLTMGNQPRWRCHKADCNKEFGIRVNTWFAGSKIPFRSAIFFIYWWAKEKTSVEFCHEELNMSQHTTVDWNNYMREVSSLIRKCFLHFRDI